MCLACFKIACTGATGCNEENALAQIIASRSGGTVSDFTALLLDTTNGPVRWNANLPLGSQVFITYSFTEANELPSVASYNPYNATGYYVFNQAQRANTRLALEEFGRQAGIVFVESTGSQSMINMFNATGSDFAGWANYPSVWSSGGNPGRLVMDVTDNFEPGSSGFQVMLHELGHAVGLKHPFQGNVRLTTAMDTSANTVMSYTWSGGPYSTLRPLDIDAIRHLYGTTRSNDGWSWNMRDGVFRLNAGSGNDQIQGVLTPNLINGRGGNDFIHGLGGNDTLYGGSGNDTLMAGGGNNRLFGGLGADRLVGGFGNDRLNGGGGNDTIYAGAGADTLIGGGGNDVLFGDSGQNRLEGGAGNDVLNGGTGSESHYGGKGNDTIYGGASGNDLMFGGSGADLIYGDARNATFFGWDTIRGGGGNDTIYGMGGSDSIRGDGGNDRIYGGDGWDTLRGDSGNDRIWGGTGNDRIFGGTGRDTLRGDDGADLMYGGPGNDVMYGGTGWDTMYGDGGRDLIYGGDDRDFIYGGSGNDTIYGGNGNDVLYGDSGNDVLYGGAGDDMLFAGTGANRLFGGAGRDVFVFIGNRSSNGNQIMDFEVGQDRIQLNNATWSRSTLNKSAIGANDTLLTYGPNAEIQIRIVGVTVADFDLWGVSLLA